MLRSLCEFAAKHLPSTTIVKDGVKYLSRYYILLKDHKFGNIYLHHFHRSDADVGSGGHGLLHNHPVTWAFGFVLVNGYLEERRNADDTVNVKLVKPFRLNFLTHKEFHRVDLIKDDAWTLFVTGPRASGLDWGFWDRITKEYIPWRSVPGAIE
jgi:hypothetical protein